MGSSLPDDLSREVYGVMGIPLDAVDMAEVVRRIELAAGGHKPFLLSTPNLNFLIASQTDEGFRDSLLRSDLCTADGMPIVWICRLLGVPIRQRIAGSDIFEALKARPAARRLKAYFFGGEKGVAAAACEKLNAKPAGLECAGWYDPGFASVDEMSTDRIIAAINASGADFLAAALGARKGQDWLLKNHDRLGIPVRSHLGATINFQADLIRRAPGFMRQFGLEWLWRIREEPYLWQRYWKDGWNLLKLLAFRVLPLAFRLRRSRVRHPHDGEELRIEGAEGHDSAIFRLSGDATIQHVVKAIDCFRAGMPDQGRIVMDFAGVRRIDPRFMGFLLVLRKSLESRGARLEITGVSRQTQKIFFLNGFRFFLTR